METWVLLLTALLGPYAGGDEIISVHPGKDVVLTGPDCSGMTSVRLQRGGSDKYVDYCREGHAKRPEDEDPSFVGRVEGLKCPMQDGNVSVTLKNVTREDAGEYQWFCIINSTRNSSSTVHLNVTDPGAADGGNTSGNATSGRITSGRITSGNATSGRITSGSNTSGNATSGNAPDVGAIVGGVIGVVAVLGTVILILSLYRSRFRCRIPCRLSDQQDSELPVAYRGVNQQQD